MACDDGEDGEVIANILLSNGMMTYGSASYPTSNHLILRVISHDPCGSQGLPVSGQIHSRALWLESRLSCCLIGMLGGPFELGSRACMGRALAMDEMRVVLLLTVRWFDFALADDGSGICGA